MEITKKNFNDELPSIREAIQEASFFAMDCEFTGLASDRLIFPFDTPEEVYLKTIEASPQYIIVQFGLCAFRVEPPAEGDESKAPPRVTYKCYNFYCYPKGRTHVFSCQGESMRFLADNGFDFNKLFREGLSYASEADEQRFRAEVKERQAARAAVLQAAAEENSTETDSKPTESDISMIPVPEENQQQVDDTDARISAFLQSEEKELIVGNGNAFQRKLIYQMIEQRYTGKVSTSTVTLEDNQKAIKVERKRTAEAEQAFEQERIAKENEELDSKVGLSLVLQELSKARKLIVGHNMLLDLLYILRQFFKPLPTDYKEFKKLTKEIFPIILDTKYLCTNAEIKVNVNSSVLAHVYDAVRQPPFSIPDVKPALPAHEYNVENGKQHEAGYDAYLTGMCFLGLVSRFEVDLQNPTKDPVLRKYLNRIFILRLADINYIYLNGSEPTHSRDHVFYVTFPETWRSNDLVAKFKPFGSVHLTWMDNTSAFVTLHNRTASSLVLKTIGYHTGFSIYSFAQFSQMKLQHTGVKRGRNSSTGAVATGSSEPGGKSDANGQKKEKEEAKKQKVADNGAKRTADDKKPDDDPTGGGWQTVKRSRTTFKDNDEW